MVHLGVYSRLIITEKLFSDRKEDGSTLESMLMSAVNYLQVTDARTI